MIRVLVVDDHQLFRQGVYALLMNAGDIEIGGEARDGFEAIEQTRRLQPDVVLMDIEMPRMDGVEATRHILEQHSTAQILMLSMRTGEHEVYEAARCGARGYLIKNCSREELTRAIRTVHEGRKVCSPEIEPFFSAAGK